MAVVKGIAAGTVSTAACLFLLGLVWFPLSEALEGPLGMDSGWDPLEVLLIVGALMVLASGVVGGIVGATVYRRARADAEGSVVLPLR